MKLTRRQLVVGTAAGAVGAAGIYELVDQLAGSTPARTPVAALRPEQHLLDGIRVVRSDRIEVLVPPLHHRGAHRARRGRCRRPARRAAHARSRTRRARGRLPAVPGRARRDGGVGEAVLRPVRARRCEAPHSARPARRQVGAPRCRALPERPRRHDARAQRGRDPLALRLAAQHRRRGAAPARDEALQAGLDPARLRRRRVRRQSLAAEAARRGGADSRRRPDPGYVGALPRLHVHAEGRHGAGR